MEQIFCDLCERKVKDRGDINTHSIVHIAYFYSRTKSEGYHICLDCFRKIKKLIKKGTIA